MEWTEPRLALYEAVRAHPGWTKEALAEVTELSRHDVGGILAVMLLANVIRMETNGEPRYWAREEATDA